MREQLINFETAKLAKTKGFNWKTHTFYSGAPGHLNKYKHPFNWNEDIEPSECSAPTQAFLQKWLRETHKIEVFVSPHELSDRYQLHFWKKEKTYYSQPGKFGFKTYEEALEEGLQQGLNLIK